MGQGEVDRLLGNSLACVGLLWHQLVGIVIIVYLLPVYLNLIN